VVEITGTTPFEFTYTVRNATTGALLDGPVNFIVLGSR
jgi:hypothetical protein